MGRPIQKKKSVTANIIRAIVNKCAAAQCSLKDLRTATFCTLGFAGFFRVGELRAIQPNQITFYDSYIEIKILRSKTDVYREGNVVYISRFSTKYCPAALLFRYMSAAGIDPSSSLPLFLLFQLFIKPLILTRYALLVYPTRVLGRRFKTP